jgi:hypothetical protein
VGGGVKMKNKIKKSFEHLRKFPSITKKQIKINVLENKVATLESVIKEDIFQEFMRKLGEPLECERLRKENQRLRKQVKTLKEIIKEGK